MVNPALTTLARRDAAMSEVMEALRTLDACTTDARRLRVGIASNVTVGLLGTYLRRHGHLAGASISVQQGSYDDLLGDLARFAEQHLDLVVVLPFFDNLLPSLEARIEGGELAAAESVVDDYLARLDLAFGSQANIATILLVGGHLLHAPTSFDATDPRRPLLERFNAGLAELAVRHAAVRYLDSGDVLCAVGRSAALDARFYYRAKAPYTPPFLDELARRVGALTRGFGAAFYKVLVLDCDNTLWGGTVGEDGLDGIALDPHSYPGNVFWTVQQQVRALEQRGVLVCLASKNEDADVREVLENHPHSALSLRQVVARRVNWQDKPKNLEELAQQLDLGLESFVFVDDSDFEVEAVRERLPMVRTFRVPERLCDYPALMRSLGELFLAGGVTNENASKTAQYRAREAAAETATQFKSHEDYLHSLGLRVRVSCDVADQVARVSELISKSNQFNLTTLRLSPGEVAALIESPNSHVYALSVADKFTDHGLTGVLITEDAGDALVVRAFLMSCRVIGRGVEHAAWPRVFADAAKRGLREVRASYVPSTKNAQVADFFDKLGFERTLQSTAGVRTYTARIEHTTLAQSPWLEVVHG